MGEEWSKEKTVLRAKIKDKTEQWSPTLLEPRTSFRAGNFSMHPGVGMVWGSSKHIIFLVHFISIIISSALPQIVRY